MLWGSWFLVSGGVRILVENKFSTMKKFKFHQALIFGWVHASIKSLPIFV